MANMAKNVRAMVAVRMLNAGFLKNPRSSIGSGAPGGPSR